MFTRRDIEQLSLQSFTRTHAPARAGLSGELNPNARLDWTTVRILRELREDGWTYDMLAEVAGVTKSAVARIIRGEVWRE